ncbi:MAG: DNA-processing protein DprA [Paludibacteraceae bacterium]|nr:DNA-processing protein DprA [Paludibacteraceae bacterium]
MDDKTLSELIALTRLYPGAPRKVKEVLEHYGSAHEALGHSELPNTEEALRAGEKEVEFVHRHRVRTWFYQDDAYPTRLRQCSDCPVLLYTSGHVEMDGGHMLSIVGTRAATEGGKELTRRIVLELAAAVPDLTIVSGLAYGIDVAAHRAAIEAGIPTLIVPAHGLDRIYPSVHRPVAVAALEHGGIVTEYPSGTTPLQGNFVARNRIVAGLSDAVLVVESKARGGALITASMANDYDREVLAVPGRPSDMCSEGCNRLIRDNKAHLVGSAEDILSVLMWSETPQRAHAVQTSLVEMSMSLSETGRRLLELLRTAPDGIHINNIVMETGLSYQDVAAELMTMELESLVRSLPGGVYRTLC